jgi:hypothetical protein
VIGYWIAVANVLAADGAGADHIATRLRSNPTLGRARPMRSWARDRSPSHRRPVPAALEKLLSPEEGPSAASARSAVSFDDDLFAAADQRRFVIRKASRDCRPRMTSHLAATP